ncbi:HAD-IA family hydrolase [Pseudanabaena sp. FACHB-1998]|uniref:HAD-IA family hydrolase n=1 Tax=Pseudanabaena sp. FACHB-1998 TaxID=2692858 RepID=UPI00168167D6|nr:HAD-IA family hydrolase [Pseudanabaena sp. FACHB-1998]MBD2176823.1 HAD-IA family hydrolase [Pseudanabaena sp. FACHB-1998]
MRSPQTIPKIIYLDAVGTLFGVKGSVGDQYAIVAQDFGVSLDSELINQSFYKSFQAAPRMAFPSLPQSDIPVAEYEWWYALAKQTFGQTGDLTKFENFDVFFQSLYAYFATDKPWFVYEDTKFALDTWKKQGIILGLLSNFDSRLYSVVKTLELETYFDSITISTEAGSAKPDRKIFETALKKHSLQHSPDLAWHIGDSFSEDYQGAISLGINAFWLNRDRAISNDPQKQAAQSINKLTDLLG